MNQVTFSTGKHPLWVEIPLTILIPILGMAMGVATMFLLNLNRSNYGNLFVNLFYLISVIVLICLFKFSSDDLGLKVIQGQMQKHVILSLAIFTFYMLVYVFVIHISTLKPFTSGTLWGLATYWGLGLVTLASRNIEMKKLLKRLGIGLLTLVSAILLYAYLAYPAEYVNRALRWGDLVGVSFTR